MSNYLAIAAVTATLQRILQVAVQQDIYGSRATTVRPNALEQGIPEACVNIFLYMVTPNTAYRNADTSSRRPQGELVKRTQTALNLEYLLSFHGNDTELEPQRMMGCVIRSMQSVLKITPEMIRETLADPTFSFLGRADLADQLEPIAISPVEISMENLSKIWSVFFQTPYVLSAIYRGSVVFIEGEEPGVRALPARERRYLMMPFRQIVVERVISHRGVLEPIVADSTLLILGQRLHDSNILVRIGELEIAVQAGSDSQVIFPLTSVPNGALRAGVQSLQVVHPGPRLHLSGPYRGIESNLASFVLRPTIISVRISNLQVGENDTCAADLTVEFNLIVGQRQLVILILNEWSIDSPVAYTFKAPPARGQDVPEVTFPVEKVKAGEYLVRVQVDGAESVLSYDTDPTSPTSNQYISPRITI